MPKGQCFSLYFIFYFFFSLSLTFGEATASKLDMDGSVAPEATFVNRRRGLIFLILTSDLLFATQVKTKMKYYPSPDKWTNEKNELDGKCIVLFSLPLGQTFFFFTSAPDLYPREEKFVGFPDQQIISPRKKNEIKKFREKRYVTRIEE